MEEFAMKIRTDFVTNSSSSSFILSRKGPLTEAQKDAIIKFVEENFLGNEVVTLDNFEQFCKENYIDDDTAAKIKQELDEGRTVHCGSVSFEEDCAWLYQECWEAIKEAGSETFKGIDTDLSY